MLPSVTLSRMGGQGCEASPKGESRSNGEVERVVQAVHGLARTLKDFLEQQSGITLESQSPLLTWLVEHCSNLLPPFHKGEPHDGHFAFMRYTSWSQGGREVCLWVKTTERIVMDETGTCVVQFVRRVKSSDKTTDCCRTSAERLGC